ALMRAAITAYPSSLQEKKPDCLHSILGFIRQRLDVYLQSPGFSNDEITAVLEPVWTDQSSNKDIADAVIRLQAIQHIRTLPDFNALSAGFKRACNILTQAQEQHTLFREDISADSFTEPAELNLFHTFAKIKNSFPALHDKENAVVTQIDYQNILTRMVSLRPALDEFFETVMVMVDQEDIRSNRLGLLNQVVNLYRKIADFSQFIPKT
ncbi:MAG: hypothetical protein GF384_01820, partial [Elusimicrobia bacterium]|nr:hypothetical protein [Elusimicrobiota bacterium]MBD3411731.1 hypothetical protein [Elusimicrobiota bacterium]